MIAEEDESEPETPVFSRIAKQHVMQPSNFTITPMQTPALAAYQEKQLKHMKVDHLYRRSDTTNRRSDLTAASTMREEEEMPFEVSKTVKHTHKKSLMLAAENMLSPKSMRRDSIPFAEPTEDLTIANRTSVSNRMRQLDRSIEDHVKQLTRPKASRERDDCFATLKKGVNDKYNEFRRSNLDAADRMLFDQAATKRRQSTFMKNTLEAHHLHNKFSDKMKKRLNDSPLRRMK